jgi:mannosyltransferase OCH1-like enzyme
MRFVFVFRFFHLPIKSLKNMPLQRWVLLGAATVLLYLITRWFYFRWVHEDFSIDTPTLSQLQYLLRDQTTTNGNEEPTSKTIPRILHLTYANLTKVPQKVYDNLRQYAADYDVRWYSDENARDFLRTHFAPIVGRAFDRAILGAHKADLLRYCLLYIHGGVYIDVKTVLIRPLDQVFQYPEVNTYLVHEYDNANRPQIYNGVIATYPHNPFFLSLIHNYIRIPTIRAYRNYAGFLRQMYRLLQLELGGREVIIEPGKAYTSPRLNVYLFSQQCTTKAADCADGLDRYGFCCYLYDKSERIIKVRYSDFPWK